MRCDRRSPLNRPLQQEKLAETKGPIFGALSKSMMEMANQSRPEPLEAIARYLADTTAVLKNEMAKIKGGQLRQRRNLK